jgi:hypothetical protein
MRTPAVMLLLTVTFAACSPATDPSPGVDAPKAPLETIGTPPPSPTVVASGAPATTASLLTLADVKDCPVSSPGKAPEDIGDRLFGSTVAFGNTDLWVGGLGEDGVILADSRSVESDGSIGWKFGWWRIVPGRLTITGRRLDAPSPPPRASVPDGYGTQGFQASGVSFPTEGCWEVTGSVGGSELTFVNFVLRT